MKEFEENFKDGFDDEYDDWEMSIIPVFSLETHITYYCDDGYRTSDLEEAKAHGYGAGRSKAYSWGHGNAFATFDYSILPVIENFNVKLEKNGMFYTLSHYSDKHRVMRTEVWYTGKNLENGVLKPLVGTAENPYRFIDQGVDDYMFERDGYVIVLSAVNWESGSDLFSGFRVKAEEFYKAWNEMVIPEPYK